MTQVKICGIRSADEARAALAAGADLLGFVFYPPVRRFVRPELAADILRTCRSDPGLSDRAWKAVGVFVNSPSAEVNAIARLCGLDAVQLCGEEDPEYCSRVEPSVIKVLRAGSENWNEQRLLEAQRGYRVERFMVDSHVDGYYGGTGVASDWSSLAGALDDKFLAGGLRPENVAEALKITHAWGVDVSSGVERDERKDPDLMQAFVREVRDCDRSR